MAQPLNYLRETASQTAGPYVHIGLAPGAAGFQIFEKELGTDIAGPNAKGERITVEGVVTDGTGARCKDVLIEVWQANAAGIYDEPGRRRADGVEDGFRGWGRIISDFNTGLFAFETVKPGIVPGRAAARWRRTSTCGSSPAASTSGSTPGCTSTTRRRRTPTIRSSTSSSSSTGAPR